MKPQQPPDPGRVQGWAFQRRPQPKVQRHIPRYMAYPPRGHYYRPDKAMNDVAVIAWSIAFLLFIYWVAPLLALPR